jgi:flagellar basal-body rod protein FlgB
MREGEPLALLEQLFGSHLNNLQRALGRSAERHSLLTANLANLNTPGYKRKDLDFGIALDDELGRKSRLDEWRRDRDARRTDDTSLRVDGNNVDLEKEVFSIAETELRFQALTDMTAGYFSGLKNVIREGK